MAERILMIDDDNRLAGMVSDYLGGAGFRLTIAPTAREGEALLKREAFDAVILDLMLPDADGLDLCRRLRASTDVPILMLTARDEDVDKIIGLEVGADDYLTKPFSFAELLARLRALVRRGQSENPDVLSVGDLRLELLSRRVWRGTSEVALSQRELALLEAFMRAPGRVLSRVELLAQAWHYDFAHRSNVIEVYIRYLRQKIDRPFDVRSLETVRGAGYRLHKDGGR